MFEAIAERLSETFRSLAGRARITEANVSDAVKDVRRALLEADVNYKIVKDFTERVKQEAIGQEVIKSVTPAQLFVKIIYDELVKLLGEKQEPLRFSAIPPTIYMIVGLNGAGKTTFTAKLALYLKSQGRAPFLIAADIYRPAAAEQLAVLADKIGIPYYREDGADDAIALVQRGLAAAKSQAREVVIIDTAGRQTPDSDLMAELKKMAEVLNPTEVLLVLDAMTGQDAVTTAQAFRETVPVSGFILSKMDGDARGGAALSLRAATGLPIKFIGTGEKPEDLSAFYPERIASRILGMGDIVSFVEKAQAQYDADKARKLQEKLSKNKFDLEDMLDQLRTLKKMGNIRELLAMIPGFSQMKDMDIDEKTFKHIEAIILSMTPEERRNPAIINGSRRRRIAMGSGTSVQQVNQLLREFEQMKKLLRSLNKFQSQGRDPRHAHPLFRRKG
ncbi:MAG: signal recognition particle protein [Bacteroidia bacterium]|nr:signal recognition particle protein [Bacteroidia bacterium]MCX7651628.1 signal recognition particle protein [Bacteroidia bacterium]MDW8415954.1 signal recognition particle protein [Bacteroidia bacterium]